MHLAWKEELIFYRGKIKQGGHFLLKDNPLFIPLSKRVISLPVQTKAKRTIN